MFHKNQTYSGLVADAVIQNGKRIKIKCQYEKKRISIQQRKEKKNPQDGLNCRQFSFLCSSLFIIPNKDKNLDRFTIMRIILAPGSPANRLCIVPRLVDVHNVMHTYISNFVIMHFNKLVILPCIK